MAIDVMINLAGTILLQSRQSFARNVFHRLNTKTSQIGRLSLPGSGSEDAERLLFCSRDNLASPRSPQIRLQLSEFLAWRAENEQPIGYGDDWHICLVSGGGKGTSIIVNNLCYWPGSGRGGRSQGRECDCDAGVARGQAVHVLDPFRVAQVEESYRSCFNPLDALDPRDERTIDEANRLANAIVVVRETWASHCLAFPSSTIVLPLLPAVGNIS